MGVGAGHGESSRRCHRTFTDLGRAQLTRHGNIAIRLPVVAAPLRVPCRRALLLAIVGAASTITVAATTSPFADDRGPIVAAAGDAYVAHAAGSEAWSIGSAQLQLVLGFDAAHTL